MLFRNKNAVILVLCAFDNVCTQRLYRLKELSQLIGTTTMMTRKRHRDSEVKKIGKLYNLLVTLFTMKHLFKMNNWCHREIKIASVIIITSIVR